MSTLTVPYKHPSDLSVRLTNTQEPPKVGPPSPIDDKEEYLCGSLAGYPSVNAGRDQDRSRLDECIPASYHYPEHASGVEAENETGVTEGF
jgi:hypothetical protein